MTPSSLRAVTLLAVVISTAALAAAESQRPAVAAGNDELVRVEGCVMREAEYARAAGRAIPPRDTFPRPQLILLNAATGVAVYSLTGARESQLAQHVARRVEITATVEHVRRPGVATSAREGDAGTTGAGRRNGAGAVPSGAGITPGGSPAHEPGDALPGSATVEPASNPADTTATSDPVVTLDTLPRLNVTSFRTLPGDCTLPQPIAPATQTSTSSSPDISPRSPAAVAAPAESSPQQPRVTAVGCVARQTPLGAARGNATTGGADELVLTAVSMSGSRSTTVTSAVPGSTPSGSGSGTVETATSASRGASPTAGGRTLVLAARDSGERAELTKRVGQRIEVVGTIDDLTTPPARAGTTGRAETTPSPAHPSSPTQRLTVISVRPIGGTCG